MPVVRAVRRREHQRLLADVARLGIGDRAAAGVDALGPGLVGVGIGREELPARAIEHVEEAVLRCLHDHLARRAADGEIGEDQVLRRGVVPGVAGRGLVVPDVFAGIRVERDDRGQVQVVAAARAAVLLVPRRAVADADVEQVELRVVGHRVPHRAAAADLPPLAARPGRRRPLQRGRFKGLRRIARHGVEAPFHARRFPRRRH